MNYRLFGAFVAVATVIPSFAGAADLQNRPTKEILLPPQTGSHLPHRVQVPIQSQDVGASAKKKKESKKQQAKKKEAKRSPAKPSPTPATKEPKPEEESAPLPERFR